MKSSTSIRYLGSAILIGAVAFSPLAREAHAQAGQTATQSLLDKAHALEARGRLDMASQTWQQVLLADPNNTEALAGLARAAKISGNISLSNTYLDRLRAINPNDPGIARAQSVQTQQDHAAQLQQAGKLAQAGQYGQAMGVYRQIFGDTPPPGDTALAYYETESATEEGRAHAIAGLRSLAEKFPTDSRYQVALGRILTYNPKTRAEGRRYLERHPDNPQAVEALRQSLLWDAQNPASSGDIRAYLAHHPDAQLAQALHGQARSGGRAVPLTPEQQASLAAMRSRTAEDQAAYKALNAKHMEDAEQRFKAILSKKPDSANALAGMGYIRMQQANFGGAISFLMQAKQDGSKDPGLEAALATSRFWYTMGEGAIALNENDLPSAEKQYRTALVMRPNSPEALEGLGGTLLKAQQPESAAPVFEQFVKSKPSAAAAWRGLFMAQYGAGNAPQALDTERRIPANVHAELMKDPQFLRTLASAYSSVGRDADAQRVLSTALDLPFPRDGQGFQAETQMQYASLLQQANRMEQAGGLYRQVLAKDPKNASAWQGLIRVEHAMNQDQQALQTLESMPPATYASAMRDPGFETTVASIYQQQKKFDIAQDLLEKAVAQQTSAGQKPSVPIQVQLAGIYLARNNAQQAFPIYQQVLSENPERVDAWKGLISSLHSTGRDADALAQAQQAPAPVRAQLENDVDFLQVMGAVYSALGQPRQSALFVARVKQHYAAQNTAPPADIDIQNAWLLYNGGNDAGLYRQLMSIGGRPDLSEEQRRTVQTIWTNWAVRRANQAAASGNFRRSLAILNATARTFPDNPAVIKALAGGYARAGMAKQAVQIWKAQDMNTASASDYKAAVGAALAAEDNKDAEIWLRFGLDQYPKDAEMLNLAAKFEQARGDTNRAAMYYRASLSAMPAADPGAELATELSRPTAAGGMRLPNGRESQDLSTLLKPGTEDRSSEMGDQPGAASAPYLPSYGNSSAGAPAPLLYGAPVVPQYMANPVPRSSDSNSGPKPRLKDYVPQASADVPVPMDGTEMPPIQLADSASDADILTPALYQQEQISRLTLQAQATALAAGPLTSEPTSASLAVRAAQQDGYGAYVPYQPSATTSTPGVISVQLGDNAKRTGAAPSEVTDVLPTARYVGNAQGGTTSSSHPDLAAANAASIRRQQSTPDVLTASNTPHADEYSAVPTKNTQYTNQPLSAAQQGQAAPQVAEPRPTGTTGTPVYQAPPLQTGDSFGQQYPQPNTGSPASTSAPTRTTSGTRRHRSHPARPVGQGTSTPEALPAQQPTSPALSYSRGSLGTFPGDSQPSFGSQPYPQAGPAYPMGTAPSDADLMEKQLPPLRGNYTADEGSEPTLALTPRQQTERDLATLEASYSGWLGGTGSARYRSGTPGIDRLTDLEAEFEASAVVGNGVRFTVLPKAVFLNSGVLDVAQYAGQNGISVPTLGTLSANASTAPAQQVANGIGGEFQVSTRNFAASVGYTPYEFLVHNVIARAQFQPNRHFTLFFDRDAVKQTQLSYAGLRDPGAATAVYAGPIWGGVVSTGGGARFDAGNERAGFYLSADGANLSGVHVLQNSTFEASMGAYFLAKTFPGYGKLNLGATLFGMHYAHNERGETYGLGGYFSPEAYFLAAIPITYTGYYKTNFHYTIAGSIGVQTFQEDNQIFFPLDPGIETSYRSYANGGVPCTIPQIATHVCGESPVNSNTGFNYGLDSEGAYRVADHWFVGGFLTANNTNNYNTISGGFFVRYLFKPQFPSETYPTGLFPVRGTRPLRVP